jgi:hypothetical protein
MIRTVLVILGVAFILIGLLGFVSDNFAGTHLTLTHNLIHLVSGAASLYFGLKGSIPAAKIFALAFGATYLLLGVGGYWLGMTGTSTLPAATAEGYNEHMFRVIPGYLELGSADHLLHFILGMTFIVAALLTRTNLTKYAEGNPE